MSSSILPDPTSTSEPQNVCNCHTQNFGKIEGQWLFLIPKEYVHTHLEKISFPNFSRDTKHRLVKISIWGCHSWNQLVRAKWPQQQTTPPNDNIICIPGSVAACVDDDTKCLNWAINGDCYKAKYKVSVGSAIDLFSVRKWEETLFSTCPSWYFRSGWRNTAARPVVGKNSEVVSMVLPALMGQICDLHLQFPKKVLPAITNNSLDSIHAW